MTANRDNLLEALGRHSGRTAIVADGREYAYTQVAQHSRIYAGQFRQNGISKGDVVGIMLPNSPEYIFSLLALWIIGATVIPVNMLYKKKELTCIIQHSRMKGIIAGKLLSGVFPELKEKELLPATFFYQPPGLAAPAKITEKDIALIIYTSGTTGTPKGVMLTFKNLLFTVTSWLEVVRQNEDDIVLLSLPLFHIFGLTLTLLATMHIGGKGVLLPRFIPENAAALIAQHKVTIFPGVPTMFIRLLDAAQVKATQLVSLKFCVSGGSSLPAAILNQFESAFKVPIVEGYGLSEASPLVSVNPPYSARKAGSVGPPIPRITVSVVDEKGKPLKPGEVGEIVVRGGNTMKGYYRMPQATDQTLKAGCLHTGDLGRLDEAGYLFIVGRRKDLIITSGYNVFPREVEETIAAKPEILEAAVIGIPDPVKGEVVKAYVVLKDGMECKPEDIIDHCKAHTAPFKSPKVVEFVDALPRNITGKVLKNVLCDSHAAPQPTLEGEKESGNQGI